jgi:DNA-binding transcriptional ArsR family regulator
MTVLDLTAHGPYPEYEDCGLTTPSPESDREYVNGLLLPERILDIAAMEGTGKSQFVDELRIRIACHNDLTDNLMAGVFAITEQVNTLLVSEMHPTDIHKREASVLSALGLTRAHLQGRAFRAYMWGTANGNYPLMDDGWLDWLSARLARDNIRCLIFDTITSATGVESFGVSIPDVYRRLYALTAKHPGLSIVLLVHLKKPSGIRFAAKDDLSQVLGEWGRLNDVTLLMVANGKTKVHLFVRKRVEPRDIDVTKRGGLFVDPLDKAAPVITAEVPTKIARSDVLAAVPVAPGGTTAKQLAEALGVAKSSASNYLNSLVREGVIHRNPVPGNRGHVFQRPKH